MAQKKEKPTREEVAALVKRLRGAPVIRNQAQMNLWQSVGAGSGWEALSEIDRAALVTKIEQLT